MYRCQYLRFGHGSLHRQHQQVRKFGICETWRAEREGQDNQLFCIKKGTTVVWMTSNKNTGFMISFGTDNPFDPDDPMIGGANKQITVRANTPGCYKYDAGAFYPGATYGIGGGSKPELVILP